MTVLFFLIYLSTGSEMEIKIFYFWVFKAWLSTSWLWDHLFIVWWTLKTERPLPRTAGSHLGSGPGMLLMKVGEAWPQLWGTYTPICVWIIMKHTREIHHFSSICLFSWKFFKIKIRWMRAGGMAQLVKELATMPDDPSLIPGILTVGGENWFLPTVCRALMLLTKAYTSCK